MTTKETEQKKQIIEKLLPVLKLTRAGADIKRLTYQDEGAAGEYVYGFCELSDSDHHFRIDVTASSGISMIKDICEYFS